MKYKLSKVIDIISGGTPSTSKIEYWNGDIYWLSIVDFGNKNKYVYDTEKKITKAGLENSATKLLRVNDIIISARGTVGAMAMLKKEMAFNQSCFGLRANEEFLNQDFLFYYLKYYMRALKAKTQGSVFETINLDTFDMIEIDVPDLDRQKNIAKILSDIDNKIEINNDINKELELLAKTIYDYWFVQFDFPDENGKPYKTSGGKMVYNEELKREIPEGWKVENLYKNSLTKFIETGVDLFDKKEYLATADVSGNDIVSSNTIEYETRESRANMQPIENSVWFAKMKNSIKHLYFGEYSKEMIEKYILSTGFCGLKCKNDSLEYINAFINSGYFEMHKDKVAHGATQEAVNNSDLKAIKMIIPCEELLNRFHNKTKQLYEKIYLNKLENQKLSELRNLLLPLLMNGQVGFKK